jgi:hypothetical protein
MMAALEPVREVHAARLKIQDETAEMSSAQRTEYYNKGAAFFIALLSA